MLPPTFVSTVVNCKYCRKLLVVVTRIFDEHKKDLPMGKDSSALWNGSRTPKASAPNRLVPGASPLVKGGISPRASEVDQEAQLEDVRRLVSH